MRTHAGGGRENIRRYCAGRPGNVTRPSGFAAGHLQIAFQFQSATFDTRRTRSHRPPSALSALLLIFCRIDLGILNQS
jgi:hypothetical protein